VRRVRIAALVLLTALLAACTGGDVGARGGHGGDSGARLTSSDRSGSGAHLRPCCAERGEVSPATVLVHLGLFGGPERPGGGMALRNAPYRNQRVHLIGASGRVRTARTGADGVARFSVRPGWYRLRVTCARGPRHVIARPGQPAHVSLRCYVP
jgi:hypothetical protein